ncbi:hypothetical protein V5799_016810 [Amblyomma americanum]|uniref:Deoxyuridine 5'-triphosphate nucleotidohydrolase n=1 Tax=Amblyomma americanum TaxID=6943 RepID=A0AAQ4F591_AMBAM
MMCIRGLKTARVCSAYDYRVPSGGRCVCLTDLQVCVPDGCYGRVAPRSGLAAKNGIDVGAGVVDADYRGNLGVLLFNFGDSEFTVSRGDRIAQFICERITYPELVECQVSFHVGWLAQLCLTAMMLVNKQKLLNLFKAKRHGGRIWLVTLMR